MTAKVIAFFNNKGGVGKTSLVYHLAWMFAKLGKNIIAADLDPQANLTAALVDEEELEQIWNKEDESSTIYRCLSPLIRGTGDISEPTIHIVDVDRRLGLIVGDLGLTNFEDQLSEVWPKCLDRDERSFRVTSAFWRMMQTSAEKHEADIVLIDLGPNLGAINRSAILSADYVAVPLVPDLFSLQGLHNLGPKLRAWREGWEKRNKENPKKDEIPLPSGKMEFIGYIVMQHAERLDRPVRAYHRWIEQIPAEYRKSVMKEPEEIFPSVKEDPHCIAMIKHYRSLVPMGQEARKPIFLLKPGDGAIGSHAQAVSQAFKDFHKLAMEIARRADVQLPQSATVSGVTEG